jgi:zinc transport system substrate-binding protein
MGRIQKLTASPLRDGLSRIVLLSAISLGACAGPSDAVAKPPARPSATPAHAPAEPAPTRRDQVLATTYPVAYLAERIAGGLVRVELPVPPEADPAQWTPGRSELRRFQSAELVVTNGAHFEKWLATASLPATRTIDTAQSFEREFIKFAPTTHSHGPGGAHSHEGIDGHTWLDPLNAKRQGAAILGAMIKRFPQHERAFITQAAALDRDLDALDKRLTSIGRRAAGATILANHPAYNYLAKRYAIKIINLDIDPGQEPSPADRKTITEAIPANARGIMLFESEPTPALADMLLNTLRTKPVVFSPGESREPGGPDYLAVMNANVDRLMSALSHETSTEVPGVSRDRP